MAAAATHPLSRHLVRLLVLAIILVGILIGSASGAAAVSDDIDYGGGGGGGGDQGTLACPSGTAEWSIGRDNFLPMNRWSGETSTFHSRTSGGLSLDIFGKIQRNIGAGTLLSVGDMLWSGTSGIAGFSTGFCAIDSFGYTADRMGATLGAAILHPSGGGLLVTGLIVISIIAITFSSYRRTGQAPWRQILSKVLVVGLFAVMLNGASNTTEQEFGRFSPGWLISTLNGVVSVVASAPAAALSIGDLTGEDGAGEVSGDVMSCERYTSELRQRYWSTYGHYGPAASMPLVLNNIWESTGMEAWKHAQFGFNDHADWVYCRMLDDFADVPVGSLDSPGSSRLAVMSGYWDASMPPPEPDAIAWVPVSDKTRDVSIIGWALCEPDGSGGWRYRSEAEGLRSFRGDAVFDDPNHGAGDLEGGQACGGWWEQRAVAGSGGFNDGSSVFNWRPDQEDIIEATTGQDRDFLLTLHSNKAGNSTMIALGYVLSSAVMFGVFGLLSVAIIITKLMMVVLVVSIFALLAISLLPGVSPGRQLASFASKLVGIILLSAGATLIFSTVGAFTRMMIMLGETAFTRGSVMHILWSGAAPLAAIFALSYVFTKVLKVPNPMSIQGAMAWGSTAGAVGGAVGGVVGGSVAGNRVSNMVRGATQRAGRGAVDSAVHKATGGRMGRPGGGRSAHGMDPLRRRHDRRGSAAQTAATAGTSMPEGQEHTGKGDKSAALGAHRRGERHAVSDQEILDGLGIARDADPETKQAALNAYRRDQVKAARALSREQWYARNGNSVRSAIHKRRTDAAAALQGTNGKPVKKVALKPRHVAGGIKDSAGARLKTARDAFKAAPMATIGRGAKKTVTTAAKVGGMGLAAAALGPALPFAAAGAGGLMLANKARKSQTYDRLTGDRRALAALAEHQSAQRQQRSASTPHQPGHTLPPSPQQGTGKGQESGGTSTSPPQQHGTEGHPSSPQQGTGAGGGTPPSPAQPARPQTGGTQAPTAAPQREQHVASGQQPATVITGKHQTHATPPPRRTVQERVSGAPTRPAEQAAGAGPARGADAASPGTGAARPKGSSTRPSHDNNQSGGPLA